MGASRYWLLQAAVVALAGAAHAQFNPPTWQEIQAGRAATVVLDIATIKKALLSNRSKAFRDPDSIREAKIGVPYPCPSGAGTCVCIEANGKNAMGGYTGLVTNGIRFRSKDDFTAFGEMASTGDCGKLSPFPQLNGHR